jgi:multicomponent Na+:H+ antiporter subunit G
MTWVFDAFSWFCLVGGAFFCVVGGFGLLRLPDFYTRMHAASLTDTLGAMLILAGLLAQSPHWMVTGKLLMIIVFLLVTSPTSSHALVKAAAATGVRWPVPSAPITLEQEAIFSEPEEE